MLHHLDIRLRAEPELLPHQLMSALYAKLHRALVRSGTDSVAVSFPDYDLPDCRLGDCLRLVSSLDGLAPFVSFDWLGGLRDHVTVSEASPVPAEAVSRALRRVQAKSSLERLHRRQLKRHGLVAEQTLARASERTPERLKLPSVQLTSASTGQTFRLFLRLGPAQAAARGVFNAYGLSTSATVPWF